MTYRKLRQAKIVKYLKSVEFTNLNNALNDLGENFMMPWGKYKGCHLKCIPKNYLTWIAENTTDQAVRCNIQLFFDSIKP